MFSTLEAKILDAIPNYFVIEDIGKVYNGTYFEKILCNVKEYVKEKGIQSVSIILNEKEALYTKYTSILEVFGYQKKETHFFINVICSLYMSLYRKVQLK